MLKFRLNYKIQVNKKRKARKINNVEIGKPWLYVKIAPYQATH